MKTFEAILLTAFIVVASLGLARADENIDWKIGHHYAARPGTMACKSLEDARELLGAGAEHGVIAMEMAHLNKTVRIDRVTGHPICGYLNYGPITILEIDSSATVGDDPYQLVKVQAPDLPFPLYALLWRNRVVPE
jgi:hypothetical protein